MEVHSSVLLNLILSEIKLCTKIIAMNSSILLSLNFSGIETQQSAGAHCNSLLNYFSLKFLVWNEMKSLLHRQYCKLRLWTLLEG